MPKLFPRAWPVLCAALLGGLLFSLARPAVTQEGDAKKEPRPNVHALILVQSQPPRILADGPPPPLGPGELENYRRTQLALLRTRLVLAAALRNPAVAKLALVQKQKDPVAWLEKHVRAEFLDRTELLRIAVPVGTPQEQATLTNAVTSAYLTEIVDKELAHRFKRLDTLTKLHEKYDNLLNQKRRKLREIQARVGMGDPKLLALKEGFALKELHALEAELLQVRSQLRKAQVEMAALKEKANRAPVPEARIDEMMKEDPKLVELRQEAITLETELAQIRANFAKPADHPAYRQRLALLEATKKAVTVRQVELRPAAVAQAREQLPAAGRAAREQLEQKTAVLKKLEEVLRTEMREQTEKIQRTRKSSLDLQWLRDEITQIEEVARTLGRQRQRLEVEIDAPRRIQLAQEASAPK